MKQIDIFKQVTIQRTLEGTVLECLTGISCLSQLVMAIVCLVRGDMDWLDFAFCIGLGILLPCIYLYHSYHPSKEDMPLLITNKWQVYELSRFGHYFSFFFSLIFVFIHLYDFLDLQLWIVLIPVALLFLSIGYFGFRVWRMRHYVEVAPSSEAKDTQLEAVVSLICFIVPNLLLKHFTDWDNLVILAVCVVFSILLFAVLKKLRG